MAGDITTIARPYAEAVFARARESEKLDAWTESLGLLAALASNEALAEQIGNPNVPRERIRDILLDIAGEELPEEGQNLVKLLAQNNRLSVLPEVARLFEVLKTEQRGVRQVHVISAYAIDAALQKKIAAALTQKLNAEVELTVEKDPSLIGGIEVRADDLVIDASVRGKLQKLANELQI
jgi:F-type H+-transporting ATPase subunit delta